jgi:DNA-binding response OmpR family regulator
VKNRDKALKPEKILIVEDRPPTSLVLKDLLSSQGYNIACAYTGEEGFKEAMEFRPDLIILDLSLPTMNGWEVAAKIRQTPEIQSVPIIAITAHAIEYARDMSLKAGCNEYLLKPINHRILLNTIKQLLESSESE